MNWRKKKERKKEVCVCGGGGGEGGRGGGREDGEDEKGGRAGETGEELAVETVATLPVDVDGDGNDDEHGSSNDKR